MNLRNCKECGKVFVYIKKDICPACLDKEDDMFDKVRDFLKDNPGAHITEVSEKTEVPEEKVIKFLREGRIVSGNAELTGLFCETCGAPISSGYTCAACREKLRKGIQSITEAARIVDNSKDDEDKKGMFTIDRLKK